MAVIASNIQNLYIIILITITGLLVRAADEQYHLVKIGAIFYKDETDLDAAFDMAVEDINDIGKKFELEGIKRYLIEDDSIILQQIACELLDEGVSAIFGPSSKTTSDIVDILCNMTGIPHLQFDWRGDETKLYQNKYLHTVNVAPSEHVLSMALLSLLKYRGWKTFTIVSEKSADLSRMQYLLSWKQYYKSGVKLVQFERDTDYRTLWKILQNSKEKNILLECPYDILTEVVNASVYYNMTGMLNSFIFSNLDNHLSGIDSMYSESFEATVRSIRLRTYTPSSARAEIDVFEPEPEERLQSVRTQCIYDAVVLYFNAIVQLYEYIPPPAPPRPSFAQPRVTCVSGGFWPKGPEIVAKMKNMDHKAILPNFKTQKLHLNPFGIRDDFNLDIYNPLTDYVYFVWNKERGLVSYESIMSNSTAEVKKRKIQAKEDFSEKKKAFKISTRTGEPYFFWKPEPEGTHYEGNERFGGYVVDLIYKLAEKCNFHFTFVPVPDNHYGALDPKTNEWNGIIRELIDNKAHMGICDLTITTDRKKVVDFTVPFMQVGVGLLMHKPKPEAKNPYSFLKLYSLDAWLYILVAIMLMSFVHWLVIRLSPDEWSADPSKKEATEVTNVWSMRYTMHFYLGSPLHIGCEHWPKSASIRLLVTFWWIWSIFINQLYTANMTSVITASKMEATIKDFKDLINQDKIQFGTVKGGATAMLFSESNTSEYRTAYTKMINFKPEAFVDDNEQGVKRILKSHGKYAFLLETPSLKYSTERNCELHMVGEPFTEKHYGIAVPQNAEYRTNLSIGLLKLAEEGQLFLLKKKWFHVNDTDCDVSHPKKGDQSLAVELETIGGAFMLLIYGLAFSAIIAILEFLFHCQQASARENIRPLRVLKKELLFFIQFWRQRKPVKLYQKKVKKENLTIPESFTPTTASTTQTSSMRTEMLKKAKHKKSKKKRRVKSLWRKLRCS